MEKAKRKTKAKVKKKLEVTVAKAEPVEVEQHVLEVIEPKINQSEATALKVYEEVKRLIINISDSLRALEFPTYKSEVENYALKIEKAFKDIEGALGHGSRRR